MTAIQKYKLNLEHGGVPVLARCSQFDSDERVFLFSLYCDNSPYIIPENAVVTVRGIKDDNTAYEYECEYTGNTVTVIVKEQMTIYAGLFPAEIRVTDDEKVIGSANYTLAVERSPIDEEIPISETDLPLIERAMQAGAAARQSAISAAGSANAAETYMTNAASSAENSANSEIKAKEYMDQAEEYKDTAAGYAGAAAFSFYIDSNDIMHMVYKKESEEE